MLHKLRFQALKKFDESIGLVEFFLTAIFRLIARNMGDKYFDFEGTLFQSEGIAIKTRTIELAYTRFFINNQKFKQSTRKSLIC